MRTILLLAIFIPVTSGLADSHSDSSPVAPPGFDLFLKNHRDKSFKIKIPIKQDRKPTMQEIEPGSYQEKKLKAAMYRLKQACNLREQPSTDAHILNTVPKHKKIWVEHHNIYWGKVYRKNGIAFINRVCL